MPTKRIGKSNKSQTSKKTAPVSASGSRLPSRGGQSSAAPTDQKQMSPPLPFGFLKGLNRIYYMTRKVGKDDVERLYVYAEEVATGKKFKQSFIEPTYVEQLEALTIPGTFNVQWQGRGEAAQLILTPQDS